MQNNHQIKKLPHSFRDEEKELISAGINSWEKLRSLEEDKLINLLGKGRSTPRNLKRLKGMAVLILELDLLPQEAALLMHSGVGTTSALASASPQEIIRQTGRLERQLKGIQEPTVNLAKALKWINKAKARQLKN